MMEIRANSHMVHNPKSQVAWGPSIQSQTLKIQNLGFTTSHGVQSLGGALY